MGRYNARKAAAASRIGARVAQDRADALNENDHSQSASRFGLQRPRMARSSDPDFEPNQGPGVTRDGPFRGWRAP